MNMAEIIPEKILDKGMRGYDMREPLDGKAEEKFLQLGWYIGKRLWEEREEERKEERKEKREEMGREKRGVDKGPRIVVAGDNRFGSFHLKERLWDGLLEYSPCIIDLGNDLPSPLAYVGYELFKADAIAMITASHSSNIWNGIKVNFRRRREEEKRGEGVEGDESKEREGAEGDEGKERVYNGFLHHRGFLHQYREDGLLDYYKEYLQERFVSATLQRLRIAVDPLWGSYAGYACNVFESLGYEVTSLRNTKNSFFPGLQDNSPDPHKEKNMEQLIEIVTKKKLDFGVAFDGDGDRVKLVDNHGGIVSEDEITAIIGEYLIDSQKKDKTLRSKPKVICEIKCSKLVEDVIEHAGGELVREQTGRIYLKEQMGMDQKIIFGGELSGHYFYRKPFYFVDTGEDGLFTALLLGQILKEKGKKLSDLREALPRYETSGEIRYTYKKGKKMSEVREEIGEILESLKASYLKEKDGKNAGEYAIIQRGDDIRVEKMTGPYSSVVFRCSRNDPQKFTFVFEGESRTSLSSIKNDFLQRLEKSGYVEFGRELERVVLTSLAPPEIELQGVAERFYPELPGGRYGQANSLEKDARPSHVG